MGMAPVLCLLYRVAGTTPAVYRLVNGTTLSAVVGAALPGASPETPSDNYHSQRNKVIEFQGDLYAWCGRYCYKYDPVDDDWGDAAVYGPISNMNSTQGYGNNCGVYVVNYLGVPNMVYLYGAVTTGLLWYVRYDGSNFYTANTNLTFASSYIGRPTVFRDSIFLKSTNYFYELDFSIPSYTSYTPSPAIQSGVHSSFCVFQQRLLVTALKNTTAGTHWSLYEYKNGGFIEILTFTLDTYGIVANGHNYTGSWLFTDGTYVYALLPGRNASAQNHAYLIKLTVSGSTFTESAISLPTELVDNYLDTSGYSRFDGLVDDESNPASPTIRMWWLKGDLAASGNVRTYWEWNGSNFTNRAACDAHSWYAIGASTEGGGERCWTSGDLSCWIVSTAQAATGTRVTFKCSGNPGSDVNTVRCRYSTDGSVPSTQCTIVAASVTGGDATLNGNDIETVDADSTITYSFIWNTVTDGVVAGSRALLRLEIFPTP